MNTYKHEMDMTEGSLFRKIIKFSLPLVLTGLLQCLYNAADLIIVGHFNGHIALAAVGSTSALTNLIVGVFMGLSVGAGVCAAQYIGSKEYDKVRKVVHTSVISSLVLGIIVGIFGFIFAPQLLRLMDTPDNVIEYSTLYIRIIFCGVPANLLYNYCASILRSSGDTKHPLVFLTVSGLANVVLNIILVTAFDMGVAGVAVATVLSQVLSAIMVVIYMCRSNSYLKITLGELKVDKVSLSRMLAIGIPSGIQGSLFALSNVVIQSSINSFDDIVMAGNSAAGNIEGFIWIAMNSVSQSAVTFTGQNVGAKKYDRIGRVLLGCICVTAAVWALFAAAVLIFRVELIGLYAGGSEEVIEAGLRRTMIIAPTYILCGMMEAVAGTLRGMGKSVTTMVFTLIGVCGVRILWVNTIFKLWGTPTSIYISYPVSWLLAFAANFIAFIVIYRKTLKNGAIPEGDLGLMKKSIRH
ncbi:MAG: MATE family efflux transporter [Clostridia bacterium]|nr:MATE family efflux transporter [Clostridia bacterium]